MLKIPFFSKLSYLRNSINFFLKKFFVSINTESEEFVSFMSLFVIPLHLLKESSNMSHDCSNMPASRFECIARYGTIWIIDLYASMFLLLKTSIDVVGTLSL